MNEIEIRFTLNHKDITAKTQGNRLLVDFLREDLGLTSVKKGCAEGECGACTVICNGDTVTSCTMLAGQVQGKSVLTLEGLSLGGELDILQETYMEAGAVQCGYCTPGMILSSKALLMKNPSPSEDEIRRALSGNLCRCTGYTKIIKAVQMAAECLSEKISEKLPEKEEAAS